MSTIDEDLLKPEKRLTVDFAAGMLASVFKASGFVVVVFDPDEPRGSGPIHYVSNAKPAIARAALCELAERVRGGRFEDTERVRGS